MQKRVHNELFHATDILPTLASAAGIKIPTKKNLDGIDQWDSLMYGSTTSRLDILHNIETVKGYSSYTNRGWKIINGTSFDAEFDSWLGAAPTNPTLNPEIYAANVISSKVGKALSTVSSDEISDLRAKATVTCNLHRNSEKIECIPMESPCLFNIIEDPCELNNLANVYPMKMKELKRILDDLTLKVIPTRRKQPDPQSDPIHFNGTWTWWMEDEPIKGNANNFNGRLWTLLVLLNLQYFIYRIFKRYH